MSGDTHAITNSMLLAAKSRFDDLYMPEPNSGCWLWLGSVRSKSDPYGRIFVGQKGGGGRSIKAHRLAYSMFKGPIPAGHFVCHKCDNRNCVNPDHLFTAPQGGNIRDAVRKARLNPERRKLSFKQAQRIRALYRWYHPEFGMGGLARRYGVTTGTISNILNGRSYRPSTFAVTTAQEIAAQTASQSASADTAVTNAPAESASDEISAPIPPSAVTPPAADKTGAAPLPSSAAPVAPFDNPRCLNACHLAHSRDACHDCLIAWSARPKDEQVRLWAEANEAARAA